MPSPTYICQIENKTSLFFLIECFQKTICLKKYFDIKEYFNDLID